MVWIGRTRQLATAMPVLRVWKADKRRGLQTVHGRWLRGPSRTRCSSGTTPKCSSAIEQRVEDILRAFSREKRSCPHAEFYPNPLIRRHGPGRSQIQVFAQRKQRHPDRPLTSTNFPRPLGLASTTAMSSCCTTGTSCWCSISRTNSSLQKLRRRVDEYYGCIGQRVLDEAFASRGFVRLGRMPLDASWMSIRSVADDDWGHGVERPLVAVMHRKR